MERGKVTWPIKTRLQEIRKQRGITKSDLCRDANIISRTLDNLEAGKNYPTLDLAYKLSVLLDVAVFELWPNPFEIQLETEIVRKLKVVL